MSKRDPEAFPQHDEAWSQTDGEASVSQTDIERKVADHEGALHEFKLEQELRRALEKEEFEIHYQAILSLENQ